MLVMVSHSVQVYYGIRDYVNAKEDTEGRLLNLDSISNDTLKMYPVLP